LDSDAAFLIDLKPPVSEHLAAERILVQKRYQAAVEVQAGILAAVKEHAKAEGHHWGRAWQAATAIWNERQGRRSAPSEVLLADWLSSLAGVDLVSSKFNRGGGRRFVDGFFKGLKRE